MAQETVAEREQRERWGLLSGATMALGASLSFAAARAGLGLVTLGLLITIAVVRRLRPWRLAKSP